MDTLAFEHHLTSPQGEGHTPDDAFTVTFGGGECCDEVTFSVQTDGTHVTDAGFTASGCGASHAAGLGRRDAGPWRDPAGCGAGRTRRRSQTNSAG